MAFTIKGKVTDASNNAVKDVLIKAFIPQQGNTEKEITVSDDASKINPSNQEGNYLIHCQLAQAFVAIVNVKVIIKGFIGEADVAFATVEIRSNQSDDVNVDLRVQADQENSKFTVSGQVFKAGGQPVQNLQVNAFDKEHFQAPLGKSVTNADGFYNIEYNPAQFTAEGKDKVDLVIKAFNETGKEIAVSEIISSANLLPEEKLNLIVTDQGNPNVITYQVSGKVFSNISLGISNLKVVIVDKGVGGETPVVTTSTDGQGAYKASFTDDTFKSRGKTKPDLQARVLAGDIFLGASDVHYNSSLTEVLNVLLPDAAASSLKSEYEILADAISTVYKGKLGDLKESDEQQDITYIANKTGWDARAIALAALSDQFTTKSSDANNNPTVAPFYFYALFRSGFRPDADVIYHTDKDTLEEVWTKAAKQNIIPASSKEQMETVISRFQTLSENKMLNGHSLIGPSSVRELLSASGISEEQHSSFVNLYAVNRNNIPGFWKSVTDSFGKPVSDRLQLDGKLASLTINNAPLIQALHGTIPGSGLTDPEQLAEAGFYHPEIMKTFLKINNIPLPKEVKGETDNDKLENYAIHLSGQIRMNYPTTSVAHMIGMRTIPVSNSEGLVEKLQSFLIKNRSSFEIGYHPIDKFIKENPSIATDISADEINELKKIHRVYQLTDSDNAMIGLLKNDLHSAHIITGYDKADFLQKFSTALGSETVADKIYDRAIQIRTAILNITLSYIHGRTTPPVGVHSPAGTLDPIPANTKDIIPMNSLEKIFATVDYCDCKDCQSILSPAAYLVNLLQFIDNPKDVSNNPLATLLRKRPDIQYLPLTCENTNTALPYLDIVNETLEYFIANGLTLNDLDGAETASPLKEYKGHDTKDIGSDDLLANPQYVVNAAYDTIKKQYFPVSLPFHQPLELLRRYFHKMEIPLEAVMERLIKTNELERGNNEYAWKDIWMEEIHLSRSEYDILTDSSKVPLQKIFGYNDAFEADILNDLSNAKRFCNRIGITYEELFALLKTKFINPDSDLIPKIEKLEISLSDLKLVKEGDAAAEAAFKSKVLALDEAEYGGDVVAWIKNEANYSRMMELITLTVPVEVWTAAPKNYKPGDLVIPRDPVVSSLYFVCTATVEASSGTEEPRWPANPGIPVTDGSTQFTGVSIGSAENFKNLYLRFSDPAKLLDNIGAPDFIRVMRFIRIWKKLGWTIEQTDAALSALYKPDFSALIYTDVNTLENLDNGFKRLLPRLGVISRLIKALSLNIKKDLDPLIACWAGIGTHGINSLYHRMFLNPAILSQDSVFKDNGFGEYLQDESQIILDTGSPQKLIVSGNALAGDVLNTIINGITVPFEATAGMGANDVAAAVVAAINAATDPDLNSLDADNKPLPLNHVVFATNALNIITITKSDQASGFTLGASFSAQDSLTYKTLNHEPVLRAAFNLKADEFNNITDSLGFNETTSLTLSNISALYSRGWLARKLKISVKELLLYIKYTGIDPFSDIDVTRPQVLQLMEFITLAKNCGFSSAAVLYLLWNEDLSGKSSPARNQLNQFARTLRSSFNSIDAELAAVEDPNGDLARNRLTLAYGQELSDNFFTLIDNTIIVDIDYTHISDQLEESILKIDSRISYDSMGRRLKHIGLMSAETKNALQIPEAGAAFSDAVNSLFGKAEEIKNSFFSINPELKLIYDAVVALNSDPSIVFENNGALSQAIKDKDPAIQYNDDTNKLSYKGFFTSSARDILKGADGISPEFLTALDTLFTISQTKRDIFLTGILNPALSHYRKQQTAIQQLSTNTGLEVNSVSILMNPGLTQPVVMHASGDPARPALDDLLSSQIPGLKAEFYFRDTATGVIDIKPEPIVAVPDYGPETNKTQLPNAGNPVSVVFSGAIEIPETGFYNFIIDTDAAAKVSLIINDEVVKLIKTGIINRNASALQYNAGVLLNIITKVENVQTALSLKWETSSHAPQVIPAQYLYPSSFLQSFTESYTRLLKIASIGTTLSLSAKELSFFGLHNDYEIGADGWLNSLPVSDAVPIKVLQALVNPFRALLTYSRIKIALSIQDDTIVQIMRDPLFATKNSASLLFTATKWNSVFLNDWLAHFGKTISDLSSFELFNMIHNSFSVVQQTGISPRILIQSTTNEPVAETVHNLQSALRALYDPESWRDLIKPVNDGMRSLQRDAMVAYILHFMPDHINSPERLFEYFLMDVEMEPCMLTSRIRHAISSVQLFIERCIMNLEKETDTRAFNDPRKLEQWEWMKRYRVWEANRKVFLYPENWAEPELRDDQSPFFKEAMNELLQGDITEDVASSALLKYLVKLEEVAKLEPCGMFHENDDNTDHVVARTVGAHRKYFYRKKQDGSWTAWDQIKLDIEDNPVIPVVWNNRLFIFWLKLIKSPAVLDKVTNPPEDKKEIDTNIAGSTFNQVRNKSLRDGKENTKIKIQAGLCWSEYHNGKWQATKTSDMNKPMYLCTAEVNFNQADLRLSLHETDEGLNITVHGEKLWKSFLLYNTHSLPVEADRTKFWYGKNRSFDLGSGMNINYKDTDPRQDDNEPSDPAVIRILEKSKNAFIIETNHLFPFGLNQDDDYEFMQDSWDLPFLFYDHLHEFYVTSKAEISWIPGDDGGLSYLTQFTQNTEIPHQLTQIFDTQIEVKPPKPGDLFSVNAAIGAAIGDYAKPFVSEDANISKVIASAGTVLYENIKIGILGSTIL